MIAPSSSFDGVRSMGHAASARLALVPGVRVELAADSMYGRSAVGRLLGAPLLGVIWLYQQLLSPVLHFAGGPSCGCRFYPTCSEYAVQAIRVHGPIAGLFFSLKRLVRCTPFHPGGVDNVPPRNALRPRCARAVSVQPTL